MNATTKTILVTGAAGYMASWIVKQLIELGHKVHGTVRNHNDEVKINHLFKQTSYARDRLTLFESNLLVDGSFDEATKVCY
ncbi:MAG: GDP-mannose 4,6-dehydratase [Thiohalomonadales bacterium]